MNKGKNENIEQIEKEAVFGILPVTTSKNSMAFGMPCWYLAVIALLHGVIPRGRIWQP